MRLVRRISIASLVVSVATLALVLMMFIGDRWESADDMPMVEDIPKFKHTPRLNEENAKHTVTIHIKRHLVPEHTEGRWADGTLDNVRGYDCM